MVADSARVIVMGLSLAVVAWIVVTRWPGDWVRLLVAEAIVGAAAGALLSLVTR